MSDDELSHLSPAEVVAHVRRLEARMAELDAELAPRSGPPKTPQNSSTPPSADRKRTRRGAFRGAAHTAAVAAIERVAAALVATPGHGAEASRLRVRFREHLIIFLYDAAVPPTNNTSEQAPRHSV